MKAIKLEKGIGAIALSILIVFALIALMKGGITGNVVLSMDDVVSESSNGGIILSNGGIFYLELENSTVSSASLVIDGNATDVKVDVLYDDRIEIDVKELSKITLSGFAEDLNIYL